MISKKSRSAETVEHQDLRTNRYTHDPEPTKQIIQSVLLFPDSFRAHTEARLSHHKLFVMILSDYPIYPAVSHGRVHVNSWVCR
jgi:hypothetical protein